MLLKSILNRVQVHHGFVYETARWAGRRGRSVIEIEIRARRGSKPVCSRCGRNGPVYDVLPQRRFEFVPLWGFPVFSL